MEFINNNVIISGEVVKEPKFSHEVFGEKFYNFEIACQRYSGTVDTILVLISERTYSMADIELGKVFEIKGCYRSYNSHEKDKTHLILSVFCEAISEYDKNIDENKINLVGFIVKQPTYRKTPLGREIADVLIAVNRPYGKSDYIPCIAWGRNASYISELNVGTEISLVGRIQSRAYQKKVDEETVIEKIAYEVSISTFREEDINECNN